MQTVADMRGVGVKNREKFADVLCGRPLKGKGSRIQGEMIFIMSKIIRQLFTLIDLKGLIIVIFTTKLNTSYQI